MAEGEKKASEMAREKWRKLLAGVNRINIEATASATSGYSFSSSASAANVSIRADDEVAMLRVNEARISTEETIFEIQLVVTSTGTSPETQYYSCTDADQDDDDKGNPKLHWRGNSLKRSISISISMETNNFSSTDVQQGNAGNENCEPCCRRDGSKQKVLEWTFAIVNVIVELLSIVFEQLSSQHKPVFLRLCLGMSISAVVICICELVYKIWKEKATWKRKGVFPWFYHPSGVCFGSSADVIGLACACGQCIVTTINYSLFLEHGNTPIKVSIWASIFAFGQLCSKMWGNLISRRMFTSENHLLRT